MNFFATKTLPGLVLTAASLLVFPSFETPDSQSRDLYRIEIPPGETLKNFFRYTPERMPLVSSHRGGARQGFPENCISTFENTLRHTWSLLEIDPRYTKDSVIVLMHAATLERTTTGTGKLADHTFEQIHSIRLKDGNGEVTNERIPTLDEAILWAKNKTVLIMDQKDVPV
jgi:glycerophosphoryl diester phosphodiesterase